MSDARLESAVVAVAVLCAIGFAFVTLLADAFLDLVWGRA